MAGYYGYSTVQAYEDGQKPLSKWKKQDILSAIQDLDIDLNCDLATLQKAPLAAVTYHLDDIQDMKTHSIRIPLRRYQLNDIQNGITSDYLEISDETNNRIHAVRLHKPNQIIQNPQMLNRDKPITIC